MGYADGLSASREWLRKTQNADFGWGMTPGMASSLVNTAEAISVLSAHGHQDQAALRGAQHLVASVRTHIQRHPRTRYAAFPLLLANEALASLDPATHEYLVNWLASARNAGGGWGFEARNDASDVFSTSIAMQALAHAGYDVGRLKADCSWLMAQESAGRWKLEHQGDYSSPATAYAILALKACGDLRDDTARAGRAYLDQTSHWGPVSSNVAGSLWHHSTYALVVPALLALDAEPYSAPVAQAVRYINAHRYHVGSGEWTEAPNLDGRTVRVQYWAVSALSAVQSAFDPSIHSLRIDAERAEGALSEPDFVKFAMRSPWATILPARLFRYLIYAALAIALLTAVNAPALAGIPAATLRIIAATLLLAGSIWMARRRPKQFRKSFTYAFALVIFVALTLDLLFGLSVSDLLELAAKIVPTR